MNNYKMIIQYDGGRYKGWQRLGSGENTIQSKIEQVLSELLHKKIVIAGCSRTDAGVHALMQVAHFKINENLQDQEIRRYLNQYLPRDISILEVTTVPENFHARLLSKNKTYLYQIWNEAHANPFLRKYSMHVNQKLDLSAMQMAAAYFIGEHDFTAFSNAKSKSKSMVRKIHAINIEKDAGLIAIRIRGNGFLHNMVRRIVGVLVQVGLGGQNAEDIPTILQSKQRNRIAMIADACGLFLEKVEY